MLLEPTFVNLIFMEQITNLSETVRTALEYQTAHTSLNTLTVKRPSGVTRRDAFTASGEANKPYCSQSVTVRHDVIAENA